MRTKTAKRIKGLEDFSGIAALYKLAPPLEEPYSKKKYQYVVVSATTVAGRPETYIFGAKARGGVADWGELPGSQKGTLSHEIVLAGAGYKIV